MLRGSCRSWLYGKAFVLLCVTSIAQAQFNFTHIGGGATGNIVTNDEASGNYTFTGGGNDIWSCSDEFDFAWYPEAGDFDVRVRVESVEPVSRWTKAGLMARQPDQMVPLGRMAFNRVTPGDVPTTSGGNGANDTRFAYRTGVNPAICSQGEHEDGDGSPGYPNAWLRLVRTGATFIAYRSSDGVNWTQQGGAQNTATWDGGAMPATLNLGLAVSRHSSDAGDLLAVVEFRQFGNTPPSTTAAPTSRTISVGQSTTFNVAVGNGLASYVTYQWRTNGVDVTGATGTSLAFNNAQLSQSGTIVSVVVSNQLNGATLIPEGTLTVADRPVLVSVSSRNDPTGIYIQYSRPMGASATVAGNYTVNNGITVSGASFYAPDTVRLTVSTIPSGTHTVTIAGVQDTAGNVILPDPASSSFSHFNGSFFTDFTTLPAGGALYGNARVDAGILKLTDAVNSQNGAFVLNDFTGGLSVDRFTASWIADLSGGSATPADGYSFNVANNLPNGTTGEEGAGNGLTISFDTYDNGGGEAPAVEVKIGGNVIHRVAPFQVVRPNPAVVSVTLDADGTLDLVYDGTVLATNVQTGWTPGPGVRWSLAGRTGGLNHRNWFDDLSINVFTPGPITIVSQPSNTAANEGAQVSWRVVANGSQPTSYQWRSNGVAIAGATNATYVFNPLRFADNAVYSVAVSNGFSGAVSTTWTLDVANDVAGPIATFGSGSGTFTEATITFNEPVDFATATNSANYSITNASGAVLAVTGARAIAPNRIVLTTAQQTPGEVYSVVINNVLDRAGVPNAITANSTVQFAAWVFTPGFARMEVFNSIGGGNVTDLRNSPKFPNSPDEVYYIRTLNSRAVYPDDSHDNYGARIYGLFIPPTNGNYQFKVVNDDGVEFWGSTNDLPVNMANLITAGCCNGTYGPASAAIPLIGGNRYAYELIWKEGGGGDYAGVSIDSANAIPAEFLGIYADPNATRLDIVMAPQSTTRVPNSFAQFTVLATNTARFPQNYAWQIYDASTMTWTNVPGATGTNFSLGPLALADDGTQVRAIVSTPGHVRATTPATITMTVDTVQPRLVSGYSDASLMNIYVVFSEGMSDDALDPLYYTFSDELGNAYPYEFGITGTFTDATRTAVKFSISNGRLSENSIVNILADGMTDANGNGMDPTGTTTNFTVVTLSRGFVKYEFYLNVGGTTIPALTGAAKYPNAPDVTFYTNTMAWPQTVPDLNNYGLRMSGYFIPPVSGNYTFAIMNDDDADFFMSTNSDPSGLQQVIFRACCNGGFSGHTPVNGLVGGTAYYFEARVKEGGGGDYLTVGVQPPGGAMAPIRGGYLGLPVLAGNTTGQNVGIAVQPQSIEVEQYSQGTFSVTATNGGPLGVIYQWQINTGGGWVDLIGANSATYQTPFVDTPLDDAKYRVVVSALGNAVISAPATLTMISDVTAPSVLVARGVRANNQVLVTYSEQMGPSAADPTKYSVANTNGTALIVTAASLNTDLNVATLTLDPSTPTAYGATYNVGITGVVDRAGNALPNTVTQFRSWAVMLGSGWFEAYLNVGGGVSIDILTNHVDFPNNPQFTRHVNSADTRPAYPDDSHENFGGRVSGYFVPPVSGNWVFYLRSDDASELWMSPNGDRDSRVLLTAETGCCGGFAGHTSPTNSLVAGQLYYFEAIYKEGGGGDYVQVAAKLASDTQAPDSLSPFTGAWIASLADPMSASVTITQQPPSNVSVPAGSTTTLTARATGTNAYNDADVVVQWQSSTDGGATWQNIYRANGTSYTTPALVAGASPTQYRAVFYIPGATATSSVTTVSLRSRLTITRTSPTTATITWDGGGVLQSAPTITGPWTTITGATSPYPVTLTGNQQYFQVLQ